MRAVGFDYELKSDRRVAAYRLHRGEWRVSGWTVSFPLSSKEAGDVRMSRTSISIIELAVTRVLAIKDLVYESIEQ